MGWSPDALLQPRGPSCCSFDHAKHMAASEPVAEAIPLPELHFFTTPQAYSLAFIRPLLRCHLLPHFPQYTYYCHFLKHYLWIVSSL